MFVLFTSTKLTLDERKTLTKISTRKPLTTIPQTSARFRRRNKKTSKQQPTEKKAVCIIGGESGALGFHQETTEESRKQQDWFCIKLYINFCTKLASFGLYGSRNVISIKYYFIWRKSLQISIRKFKIQNIIFNASTKLKIQTLFST